MSDFRGGDVIKDRDGTTWVVYEHEWLVISEDAANAIGERFTLVGSASGADSALADELEATVCPDCERASHMLVRRAAVALRAPR